MNDKNFDGNAVEGHMLPLNLPNGPTSDPRTDVQIAAELKRNEKLEEGTIRDSQGQIRNVRDFGKDPVETYAMYLKRTDGLVDFKPLSEEEWRKQTGKKTQREEMLIDLGITQEAPKAGLYIQEGIVRQAPTGPLSTEEANALEEMLGLKQPADAPIDEGLIEEYKKSTASLPSGS